MVYQDQNYRSWSIPPPSENATSRNRWSRNHADNNRVKFRQILSEPMEKLIPQTGLSFAILVHKAPVLRLSG